MKPVDSLSKSIQPHHSTNQLTKNILIKKGFWSTAKSKSYSNQVCFKKALNRVYAQADWMVKQGYGASEPVTSKEVEHA